LSVGKVHIIGAGLAGLSAAVRLAGRGLEVEVSEAAAWAGGRCRSYVDPQLDMAIDNGNHLVLSGNRAVSEYLAAIGASDRLAGPDRALFDFADLRTGERWTLRPSEGPIPAWVLDPTRRVPQSRALDYLGLLPLLWPKARQRLDEIVRRDGPVWERLMQPFLLAVLNTEPEAGSAELAAAVLRETLGRGGRAFRPRIAQPSLGAAFVEPALAYLESKGSKVRFGRRARALKFGEGRLEAMTLTDGDLAVGPAETVILAAPPWVAEELVPGLATPKEFRAIVNGHFRIEPPSGASPMVGVIGGTAEWVFTFEDRISVTVSGADRLLDVDREELARTLWADVAKVHGLSDVLPPWQIVKERRATFAATPEQNALRPGARTRWSNFVLAGDWTNTGLPATIEGALRSGRTAADLVLARTAA
jgi:squalene-associated FAD-dependent desaturase